MCVCVCVEIQRGGGTNVQDGVKFVEYEENTWIVKIKRMDFASTRFVLETEMEETNVVDLLLVCLSVCIVYTLSYLHGIEHKPQQH